jgi:hypothetical protein
MEALLVLAVIAVVALVGAAAEHFGVDSRDDLMNSNLGVR